MYGVLRNQIDGYTLFSYLLNDVIFLRLPHNWKYTKRGEGGGKGRLDLINRFVSDIFLCMSEARTCISNHIGRDLCNVQWLKWEVIVCFGIKGIVDNHRLSFLFNIKKSEKTKIKIHFELFRFSFHGENKKPCMHIWLSILFLLVTNGHNIYK